MPLSEAIDQEATGQEAMIIGTAEQEAIDREVRHLSNQEPISAHYPYLDPPSGRPLGTPPPETPPENTARSEDPSLSVFFIYGGGPNQWGKACFGSSANTNNNLDNK